MKLFPWVKLDPKTVVTVDKVYKDDIKAKFVKVCTNAHSCRDKDGNIVAYKEKITRNGAKNFTKRVRIIFTQSPWILKSHLVQKDSAILSMNGDLSRL